MFIAVINENFDVAEEAKKSKQASTFWEQKAREGKPSWFRVLNPYRWFKASPITVRVDELPSGLVLPMQKKMVNGYDGNFVGASGSGSVNWTEDGRRERPRKEALGQSGGRPRVTRFVRHCMKILGQLRLIVLQLKLGSGKFRPGHYSSRSLSALEKLFTGKSRSDDIPLTSFRHTRFPQSSEVGAHVQEEVERHLYAYFVRIALMLMLKLPGNFWRSFILSRVPLTVWKTRSMNKEHKRLISSVTIPLMIKFSGSSRKKTGSANCVKNLSYHLGEIVSMGNPIRLSYIRFSNLLSSSLLLAGL